ncbi:hypothetical protein AMECASPLE_023169 [Ameca splendens]|uniref:Uncharacterized protein n=1 Tax=Ameca splendens TaxID=208324 RepID=A0ABV0Z2V9_9TELE
MLTTPIYLQPQFFHLSERTSPTAKGSGLKLELLSSVPQIYADRRRRPAPTYSPEQKGYNRQLLQHSCR